MNNYFLLTNDVECTSIVNHCISRDTGKLVSSIAVPKTLELYEKYNIKTTFFITGEFAKEFPGCVRLIHSCGHEVACHGFTHRHDTSFDTLDLNEQIKHLKKAKSVLENIISDEVVSFRAPALRTNKYTVKALEAAGFKVDSSVSSQRFDFFFSLGSRNKMSWLSAPRKPYFVDIANISKKGSSDIFEIPVSAFIMPYIGTTMRIFPISNNILRAFLKTESMFLGNQINFLIHPIEFVIEDRSKNSIQRRSDNVIKYYLSDVLRHRLKLKNLGDKCINLMSNQISYFKERNFQFITCKELYERYNKE